MAIFTIGHSNRTLDELVALLGAHGVTLLADVRMMPHSAHVPHFNRGPLAERLATQGIEYVHLPGLGGLRRPRFDSLNTGWHRVHFRGYADHMATDEFRAGLDRLVELSVDRVTAAMCAEAVPWKCHRSLIADALVARGIEVRHILGPGPVQPHALTPFARVDGDRVTYPGPVQEHLL
jgi:uncharacterized protein (DUF488 family)